MLSGKYQVKLSKFLKQSCSPSYIKDTRIFRPVPAPSAAILQDSLRRTPLGRAGIPLDIAKGIAFLASPLAEWIDAINLPINGGIVGGF